MSATLTAPSEHFLSAPCLLRRKTTTLTNDVYYPVVSLVVGAVLVQTAKLFRPGEFIVPEDAVASITLDFSRLVLGIQLFIAGIQLPRQYLKTEWKSLALLLGPGMIGMWACSSAVIWLLVPNLPFLHALAIAACVTPTDPVLSSSIVKGKLADEKVPKELQQLIVAESGANDGLGYPFLFVALYLIKYAPQEGGTQTAMKLFFGRTCVYVVVMSVLYGGAVGWLSQKLLRWAQKRKYVDQESFVTFPVGIAIFILGTCGMVGSDDVLACFVAGNVFTWNDWFRLETVEDSMQPAVDMMLNLAAFMWLGAVCPWESFWQSEVVTLGRLFAIGALVLLLRRLPILVALHQYIWQIKGYGQAMFVGYFGPIGVSAIFYLYIGLEFLETVTVGTEGETHQREDATRLGDTMMTVIWFLIISSVVSLDCPSSTKVCLNADWEFGVGCSRIEHPPEQIGATCLEETHSSSSSTACLDTTASVRNTIQVMKFSVNS